MVDLSVDLSGLKLDNPIIPASGTFGYGREFAALYDINILGSFSFKGTTKEPRYGNPLPRIAEVPSGMLNAVGLENPGVDAVIKKELPELAGVFGKPVIANVSGFSEEEYVYCCGLLDKEPQVGLIEVNISCPNVHGGGASFGMLPETAAGITSAVKAVTKKPVYMKLTPAAGDIVSVARACEKAGADGLSLINTLPGLRIDLKTRRPVLRNRTGGLSGPALLPIALRMVNDVFNAVSIPIIGMGGVSCAEDVAEMMLAGASAVEIGAANLVEPFVCKRIIVELPALMEKMGVKSIKELTGGVRQWEEM